MCEMWSLPCAPKIFFSCHALLLADWSRWRLWRHQGPRPYLVIAFSAHCFKHSIWDSDNDRHPSWHLDRRCHYDFKAPTNQADRWLSSLDVGINCYWRWHQLSFPSFGGSYLPHYQEPKCYIMKVIGSPHHSGLMLILVRSQFCWSLVLRDPSGDGGSKEVIHGCVCSCFKGTPSVEVFGKHGFCSKRCEMSSHCRD